jgi:glycosyltransferase involved in cell wall biosynthesis
VTGVASRKRSTGGPSTVLYVVQAAFFAGAERALILLLQALDQERYRPHVIVGTDGEMRFQLEVAGIPTTYVDLNYTDWRHPIAWVQSVRRIARVARSIEASLVHANGVPGFQPAGYAARLLKVPAVVHVRGRLAYRWFVKPGFQRALFVSQHLLDFAVAQDPDVFRSRSQVVHDGVLLPTLPSDEERRARLAELGIPTDVPSVLLSGQVVEIKGIWEYIEAARQLATEGVHATYVVLGDDLLGKGETRRRAEAVVREAGLADRFRFLGFRRDAPDLIPLFDIAAVPSHVEPLGNATLEAMAAGLPVVGSRVGGIPEMIVDGETGFLVPSHDAGSLATALSQLVRDAGLRARLGRAGRRRAADAFSVSVHAARVQQVYDEILFAWGGLFMVRSHDVGSQARSLARTGDLRQHRT